MREPQGAGRNNPHPQGRRLSPLARIIIFVPLGLLLFVSAHAGDIGLGVGLELIRLWQAAGQSLSLQAIAASSKPINFAEGQASGPTFSRSWYVNTSPSTTMSDMQALAQQDAAWTVNSQQCNGGHFASFVLLDFGEPHTFSGVYGTFSVRTNYFWSDEDIAAAAQRYLSVWRGISPNCRLKLAIGLSNHHQCSFDGLACQIPEVGVRWAEMVSTLNTWIRDQGFDQQLQVWGAYDAETTWDGADRTRQFVDGFTAYDSFHVPLVDFGDMRQGDPLVDPDTGQPEQTWTDADRAYMAWKAPYDISLPEIYDGNDLWDWVRLQQNDPTVRFLGIMTEACASTPALALTDPRVNCGSVFNGYGFAPDIALAQLKQNILQPAPLYYVTSMPIPY